MASSLGLLAHTFRYVNSCKDLQAGMNLDIQQSNILLGDYYTGTLLKLFGLETVL